MCDDIAATSPSWRQGRGDHGEPVAEALGTGGRDERPGCGELGIYEPRHPCRDERRGAPATQDDVRWMVDLAANEGWNPGLRDAEAFRITNQAGLVATDGDERVGCVSCVRYDERFAFFGFYIVVPERRGAGIGGPVFVVQVATETVFLHIQPLIEQILVFTADITGVFDHAADLGAGRKRHRRAPRPIHPW